MDRGRRRPALGDRPHDQRRAAVHVAGHEHARRTGLPVRRARRPRPAGCAATPSWVSSGCSSVPSKPIASSTRSAGSSRSVPGHHRHDAPAVGLDHGHLGDPHRPDLARAVVDELLRRRPRRRARRPPRGPGSCAGSTARSATGRAPRRGWPAAAGTGRAGGSPAAPCRWATPRQSAAVSPPPMMTHVLAGGGDLRGGSAEGRRPPGWTATRCSIARWTPRRRPPRRLRGVPAGERAAGQQHRVVRGAQLLGGHVDADVDARCGTARPRPRAARAAGRCARFSSLKSGMP